MPEKIIQIKKLPTTFDTASLTTQQLSYEILRYNIMIGSIVPGTSLTIRGIAQTLNVSPTPAREALKKLCAEGALTELSNRRIIIPVMQLERFNELIAVRIQLECHAAQRALPFINERLIDKIETIDEKIDNEMNQNNYENMVVLNQQFHSEIYKANPHQIHMPLIESIWLQLGPYTRVTLTNLKDIYLVDRHKQAIKALRDRNSENLKKAIENDISDGIGELGKRYLTN